MKGKFILENINEAVSILLIQPQIFFVVNIILLQLFQFRPEPRVVMI